jgi:abortive infection bacteriophage resistance protein
MKFSKPPLTYEQQADLVLARGLIADKNALMERLRAVSYYRLCAYWYPFKRADNSFEPGTTFDTVWRRYTFDRQLRLLVMDAIERVEITIRSSLAYELSRFGPFGHLDINNFPGIAPLEHQRLLDELHENANRSREAFVEHFKKTYDEFPDIPLWAAVETMTFGQMLTVYRNCGKHVQRAIASNRFNLPGTVVLSWLFTLNYIRNLCAHHSRLWNRELAIKPLIPHHDQRWHQPLAE